MSDDAGGLIERAAALLGPGGVLRRRTPYQSEGPDQPSGFNAHAHAQFDRHAEPPPSRADDSEDVQPTGILSTVRRRKLTFLIGTLLFMAAAAAAIFSMTPVYLAEAVVLIGNREPSGARIELKIEGSTMRVAPDPETVQTEVEILRSRTLATQVVEDMKLWESPEFNPYLHSNEPNGAFQAGMARIAGQVARVRDLFGTRPPGTADDGGSSERVAAPEGSTEREDIAVDIFLSKLTVALKTNTRVIAVQFEDRDPHLAAAAVNNLVGHYIANQVAATSLVAQSTDHWLEKTVDELRKRVAQSDRAFERFRASFEARGGRDFLDRKMADASAQLAAAELASKDAETRLARLRTLGGRNVTDVSTNEVAGSPVMQGLRQNAAELHVQLAQLSASLGKNHPKMRTLEAGIARANEEMRAEVARLITSVEGEVRLTAAKEDSLRQSLAATKGEISGSSDDQAKLNSLRAEAASNHAVLEAFLTRRNVADKASASPLPRAGAEIVSRASVPKMPAKPRTTMLLMIATVGSAMASLGVTLAREKTDQGRTFRSGEQIETATGMHTLALVPLTKRSGDPHDDILASPASVYGEAIRALYRALMLQQNLKMLVVTSAHPSEGKTTLAISLALIGAKAGRKILLVDADLCKSGATQAFGLVSQMGLAELIADEKSFSETVVTAGPSSNFHFLASGQQGGATAARSVLEIAVGILRRLSDDYDLIIIDTPPILAVSDAILLSAHADATVFAVRWGKTPRSAAKLGLKRLLRSVDGRRMAGIVLTMVNPGVHARYGYADSAFYSRELLHYYRIK